MPIQAPQPQKTQHPRPWWKDVRLGIVLLVLLFAGAVYAYTQMTPGGKPQKAHTRPIKEEAPGCHIEGTLADKDGQAVIINGNIYSAGDTACGGKITGITLDSLIIEINGHEQVFNRNVVEDLTFFEKTKIKTQKNVEALTKLTVDAVGLQEQKPTAVKANTETSSKFQSSIVSAIADSEVSIHTEASAKIKTKAPGSKPEKQAGSDWATNDQAKEKKVEIFVTNWCPDCVQLEELLRAKRIAYERFDIENNFRGKARYKAFNGAGVPLILINSKAIHGFNPDAIQAELGID